MNVELEVRSGLPAFTVVGLADTAVREARARIQAAIRNSGFEFPARRITANLAPGGLPKAGPGLDLALACALLAASGQLAPDALESTVLSGELGLDGSVRAAAGALAIAGATVDAGLARLLLAPSLAREASLIDGLEVCAVARLASAVRVLSGGPADRVPASAPDRPRAHARRAELELADVRGQHHAVRALVIAAAGAHNCLLTGAPGTGKTMLAQRLTGILPPLALDEAIEVARIHALSGAAAGDHQLPRTPPFRAPHHSITAAGLIGGATRGAVGEVVLAHRGVLFLDELSEFARPVLEALRQPLEDGRVAIARSHHSSVHPARFMLLAATNPCPCGLAGELERCSCSAAELDRHRRRLSGPLLDRIDLRVALFRPRPSAAAEPSLSTVRAREMVREARARQQLRFTGHAIAVNAHMDAALLRRHVRLDGDGAEMMRRARERGLLSVRGEQRVLRVARTVADLAASAHVRTRDLAVALALRGELPSRS